MIVEDDPQRIVEKIFFRFEKSGQLWNGHKNKIKQELLDISERIMRSRRCLHNSISQNEFNSLILNMGQKIEHLADQVVSVGEGN